MAQAALVLESAGLRVLAIDFRGYGSSRGPGQADPLRAPLHLDVLAAARYLRTLGAKTVSAVGGSMVAQPPVMLPLSAENLHSATLFIVARQDANAGGLRLPRIQAQFEKAPQPKEMIVVEGAAHAQALFETDQADRVMREILRFLSSQ